MQQEARLHSFINYGGGIYCLLPRRSRGDLAKEFSPGSQSYSVDDPVEMWCDNTAAIQYAKDPKFHRKAKHIKRRYQFVRDVIKLKEVFVKYLSANKMIADQLTKPTPRDVFKTHMMSLGLRRV